ncbi:MFS transporter [Luteolibacter marinus]|uniref:MFS transporter n=1 Tax=Luteolibacter marinus TaxID=2776705 RepID=UPI001866C297|nr:MFS transporter [Luteolibacter marinus]
MIVQQTQNAFNDKAAQFTLIPLGGAIGFTLGGARVEDIAALLISLPFILFSPLAGWLSDRFSKRDVMLGAAVAQLGILVALCLAVRLENMPLALGGFFALAVQSAFFSPAKMGINKELVGSRHLGFATGIQQMMAMLAMLSGQIAAGLVFDRQWEKLGGSPEVAWRAAYLPLLVLTALSIPAIVLAWLVPRVPAQGREKLHATLLFEHFRHLRDLWSDAPLRRASFAVAYFWGFAAFINLWSLKVAAELTGGHAGFGTLSSYYMAAASLGMIGGFALAAFLLRRRIELGWVPVGGVAMTGLALVLAAIDPARPVFLYLLGLLAFSSALFLAPLNAWMQDRYPAAKRGELQAAVNLQDCLAGIFGFVLLIGLAALVKAAGFGPRVALHLQIGTIGVTSGLITWFIIRLLPSDFVRVIGLMLLRLFYRIRSSGTHHLPEKGGALLLPNHITWGDAFFLTAASPRPIRFIMEEGFMGTRAIRVFCQLFDTVPISSAKPREALRAASDALKRGDLVCIFPEGQLTRTGTLQELKRGFELIARQAGCPMVPVWTDGAWGSILSFERNRFFKKWPRRLRYGISVAFGEPIAPKEADPERVRIGMLEASAIALDARVAMPRTDPGATRRTQRANAMQIAQVNALPRGGKVSVLAGDPLLDRLPGLVEFSRFYRTPLIKADQPGAEGIWLGGDALREAIENSTTEPTGAIFYDFSARAAVPLDRPSWTHCPCLALNGVVIALSMPDPPRPLPGSKPQRGGKEGSLGILLPGFAIHEKDGIISVTGPATGGQPIALPPGHCIDGESFLFPPGR